MAKTINRMPMSVDTDPGINYKFFAQSQWNGICTNKNYFNLDQETFEDATNVYIDSDGVLASRPPVTRVGEDGDITKHWSFGDTYVMLLSNNYLYFNGVKSERTVSKDVQLIENDGKIYVFDKGTQLDYYDKVDKKYVENCDVYIPIKYTYTNMVRSTVAESPNILTDAYIDRYLYSKPISGTGSYVNFETLNGKTATININDEKDTITLSNTTGTTLFNKGLKLPEDIFRETYKYIPDESAPPYLGKTAFTSTGGAVSIFCKWVGTKYEQYGDIQFALHSWEIYYTLDGVTYDLFSKIDGCTSVPKISQDGSFVAVLTPDAVKVKSTVTPGDTLYSDWHDIKELPDDFYIRSPYVTSLDFVDINNYVLVCSTGVDAAGDTAFRCIIVKGGNEIYSDLLNPYGFITVSVDIYTDFTDIRFGFWPLVHFKVYNDTWNITLVFNHIDTSTGCILPYLVYAYPAAGGNDLTTQVIPLNTYNPVLSHINILDLPNDYVGVYVPQIKKNNSDTYPYTTAIVQYANASPKTYPDEKVFYIYHGWNSTNVENIKDPSDTWGYSDAPRTFYLDTTYSVLYSSNGVYNVKLDSSGAGITGITSFTPYVTSVKGHVITNSNGTLILGHDGYLYSDIFNDEISIDITQGDGTINIPKVTVHNELNSHYIAYEVDGKYNIAVSAVGANSTQFKWYFPELYAETFSNRIVDLHSISTSEMGVFLENEVWYIGRTESGHYTYTKSKLPLGCKADSNVLSSYDGKNIFMLTDRGMVALSYQDFVASTDQVLSFLSDNIDEIFTPYITDNTCKLFKYKYWIIVYSQDTTIFVYDIRNNSWWKWSLPVSVSYPIVQNNEVVFANDKVYKFNTKYTVYKDEAGLKSTKINWNITSQKLHLSTLNYYKRLVNITLNSLQSNIDSQRMILSVTNYRERSYDVEDEAVLDYEVDLLRTFVKRLSYGKIVEFQYRLRNDEQVALQSQLKLNSIIIKYVITGVIR